MVVKDFVNAKSLEEAFNLLTANKQNHLVGGGAWQKLTLKNASTLISLEELELNKIEEKAGFIEIGALVTLRQIETNSLINDLYDGILSKAISNIMGINVRNIATIGGSVIGRYSFSDIIPVLEVLETKLVFFKIGEVKLMDFLAMKKLEPDILIKVKVKQGKGKGFFKKVAITPLDFSIVNLACTYTNKQIKLSIGSTPGLAKLCKKSMEYLNELNVITLNDIDKASELITEDISFSDNLRASKEYREELAKVYFKRAIKQVINYVG